MLVVDNSPSTDRTKAVVDAFPGVRYVLEPRKGLNHARNCAMANAGGEIVSFIDDDATPDVGWLRGLLRNYDSPNVMAVNGLTMPLELETDAQERFELYSSFSRGFERKTFHCIGHHPLAVGRVGAGTNMSLRRSVVETVGGFDNALDAGTPTQSGGEAEMFSRILAAGYRIVYEPAALNWHRHRRSDADLTKAIHGYGVGTYSYLIRALLWNREIAVFWLAFEWFRHEQARNIARAILRRPHAPRLGLVMSELAGCLAAPWAYWKATSRLKRDQAPRNG